MLDINFLLVILGLNVTAQLLAWLWQVKTNHADIADVVWSGMLVVNGLIFYAVSTGNSFHQLVIMIIPVLWYLRLFVHLSGRYDLKNEDGRYKYLRNHWQDHTQFKFLLFFIGQGILISIFSLPGWFVVQETANFDIFDGIALMVVVSSLIGVTLSDHQLSNFKKNSKNEGNVCNVGLWRYSRHPNYFFEWLHWFAYPLLAWHSPFFWLLLLYPFIMLVFLIKFTGIPFNEQQNIRSKGEAYRKYQKRTNKFFLAPPKT